MNRITRSLSALAAAALCVAAVTGCGSQASTAAPRDTPIRQQLAWVIDEVNGASASLTDAEVERHLAPSLLVALPATQFTQVARQASSAYAPVRFAGFAGPPSATSAIALLETRSHDKLAVYVSLDSRAPHRIRAIDVSPRPIVGPSTMRTDSRYTGSFDVGGGRRMVLRCSGSGTPTVILEAGADNGADSWFAVQPWLATTTRVCSYDRPNVPGGSSDPAPKPRTAADVVRDLHRLLAAARVPGPYILAGHSNGGLFARLYATTYPAQVEGLVLIDTGDYPAIVGAVYRKLMRPGQWRAYRAMLRNQPFVANPAEEQIDLATSYRQLATAERRRPLPRMPLVVISHGIPEAAMGAEVVPGADAAIETEWQRRQALLAHLVPGGRRVVAEQSDHLIPTAQPGLVFEQIRAVVAAGRRGEVS